MIFNLYSRVVLKLGGDEKYVYDAERLMYTEVAEIQKVTDWSYLEWEHRLRRYDIVAIGALLHVLRKRDGQPSDFGSLQFNAAQLDCVPLKDSGEEYTPAELGADLAKRLKPPEEEPGPTLAADAAAVPPEASPQISVPSTPDGSARSSASGPGNGNGSAGSMSSGAKRTSIAG